LDLKLVTELTALLISGDLQVTSVKFVAKDEYALTGSIDKVRLLIVSLHLPTNFLSIVVLYMIGNYIMFVCWNLADSQNLARAGGWELRLQTYT